MLACKTALSNIIVHTCILTLIQHTGTGEGYSDDDDDDDITSGSDGSDMHNAKMQALEKHLPQRIVCRHTVPTPDKLNRTHSGLR